jgi:PAS domain S-box-containing protein
MKLRMKAILLITIPWICAFLVLGITLRMIVLDQFGNEEHRDITAEVQQVQAGLDHELAELSQITGDWAAWDDTYDFMGNRNEAFIISNLVDFSFINNRLNLMVFLDLSGNIVISRAFDLTDKKSISIPDNFQSYFSPGNPILNRANSGHSSSGIVSFHEGPMILAAHLVVHTNGEGPPAGILVCGRSLGLGMIVDLAESTRLPISAFLPNDPQLPPDCRTAISYISEKAPVFVQPLSKNLVSGYALLKDIYENPALLLKISSFRPVYIRALSTLNYFTLTLLIIGLTFGIVLLLFMERSVVSRVSRLSYNVMQIGKRADPSYRVSLRGKDEVASLANSINEMLERLEQSRKETLKSEQFNFSLMENAPNPILVVNQDDSIRYVNPALAKLTGFSAGEIIGKKPPFPWWMETGIEDQPEDFMTESKKEFHGVEKHFKSKKGEEFWVEASGTPVVSNRDDFYYLENWVDITERRNLRKASEEFTRKLIEVQEEERKRVSRELHDDTAQYLALLKLEMDSLIEKNQGLPQKTVSELEKLRGTAEKTLQEVRRFSHELRPSVLGDFGLSAALETIIGEFNDLGKTQVEFDIIGLERRLGEQAELVLFRITQEALNNIRKHSQATIAQIRLEFTSDKVRLMIKDNGIGFDMNQMAAPGASGRLGLLGMRERAELIGADLIIESHKGEGTTISVELLF